MRQVNRLTKVFLCSTLLIAAAGAESLKSHLDLDWSAPRRWVHVDNIDPQKTQLFENARLGWLIRLRRDGQLLGDGRPLFWCARGQSTRTYITLYPFRAWADLDDRAAMVTETNKLVGEAAVKAYDSCDLALIPPHYSQIWRRLNESDIVWSGTDSLTELTASAGRMENRQVDFWHWDEAMNCWQQIQKGLASCHYPLACRVYSNSYGDQQGEYILFWLAKDSTDYQNAPSIRTALVQQLGKNQTDSLMTTLDKYFPLQKLSEIERRADLSNLGK